MLISNIYSKDEKNWIFYSETIPSADSMSGWPIVLRDSIYSTIVVCEDPLSRGAQ